MSQINLFVSKKPDHLSSAYITNVTKPIQKGHTDGKIWIYQFTRDDNRDVSFSNFVQWTSIQSDTLRKIYIACVV